MCGFIAIFDPRGERLPSSGEIRRMADLMVHRGPDHFGEYRDSHFAAGFRRLSIIDLSDAANQPMIKGDLVLVYNGEVYNCLEIQKELRLLGSSFQTQSDTEVILEAYARWGADCVRKMNGMFAFVLWDRAKQTLFVARDRLGVKPLFMARQGGRLLLASDIQSLWEILPPSGRLSEKVLKNFFSQGFISEPGTSTEGIEKFPPAHTLEIEEGRERFKKYWDLNLVSRKRAGFGEVMEETETLLKDSIHLRLRSDVPLGCFLSGGVDSSLVSALTARERGEGFHTYSIGFDSEAFDESRFAQKVANRYGTEHHHMKLNATCLEELPRIVWSYSELFGDASAVPTYFVSRSARENLTVVLTGDGADEGFGGYIDPFAVYLSEAYKKIPSPLRRVIAGLINGTGHSPLLRQFQLFNKISLLDIGEVYKGFKDGGWNGHDGISLSFFEACKSPNLVDKLLYADIHERLCYDFLVKVDMGTMAHSLEARSPFLDYRLIELGYSLDHRLRYRHFRRKAVLKAIAEKYIDHNVIHRKKMGFSIPQAEWLASDCWLPVVKRLIDRPSEMDRFVSRAEATRVLREFAGGQREHANRIWLFLWFQIWEGLFLSKIYHPEQKLSELAT